MEQQVRALRQHADSHRELFDKAVHQLSIHYLEEAQLSGVPLSEHSLNRKCRDSFYVDCSKESKRLAREAMDKHRLEYQAKQQRAEREKQEMLMAHRARVKDEIRRGDRQIKWLSDAEAFFDAEDGSHLMEKPHLSGGDGKYYSVRAYLTSKSGSKYLYWWADSPIASQVLQGRPASGAVFESPALVQKDVSFNDQVDVVGKYVRNQTIRLANGGSAVVPVFSDAYIFLSPFR